MTPRIVSLLPSATEIVCALGYQSSLVGRSHECDFPAGIERLPVCTESKVHGALSSIGIHERVTSILEQDISVYRVDAELLRRLEPTHIVTQVQCEVCAVSLRDVEAAIADWSGVAAPRIVPLNPQRLDDVYDDIRRTATSIGDAVAGEGVVGKIERGIREIGEICRSAVDKPRVAMIEWLDPLMTAGNWMPELIEIAGGTNLLGEAGKHSTMLRWDDLAAADPEVILVFPCGFDIARTSREMPLLTAHPAWGGLRAVRTGDVFVLDGNQYCNRPGPRLLESLQIIAEILHPDRFAGRFEGSGWIQWRA